jgi:hypothetical protein
MAGQKAEAKDGEGAEEGDEHDRRPGVTRSLLHPDDVEGGQEAVVDEPQALGGDGRIVGRSAGLGVGRQAER